LSLTVSFEKCLLGLSHFKHGMQVATLTQSPWTGQMRQFHESVHLAELALLLRHAVGCVEKGTFLVLQLSCFL